MRRQYCCVVVAAECDAFVVVAAECDAFVVVLDFAGATAITISKLNNV